MTYYAITKGDYSDYHICAITSDKEKAKRLKKIYSDRDEKAQIESFEEDDDSDNRKRAVYSYKVSDGDAYREYIGTNRQYVYVDWQTKEVTGAQVISTDKKHACKKAQDMIAKYKAERAGL